MAIHNINLPEQYTAKIKEEKKKTGKGVSELVRCALDLYFKEATKCQ